MAVPVYVYFLMAAGWIVWFLPFPLNKWNFKTPERQDNRARWGLVLQGVAYMLLWQGHFWEMTPAPWRIALGVLFLVLASVYSWTGVHALGRHLRFDAALSPDHQLVQSGPYRWLRHPIYTSMFCILLGSGFFVATVPLLAAAIVVFIAGTEIRVRVEDALLLSRFGAEFRQYQRSTPAYIPFIR